MSFMWKQDGLGKGKHTIEITILEDKNEQSGNHMITVKDLLTESSEPVFDVRTISKAHPVENKDISDAVVCIETTEYCRTEKIFI